MFTMCPFCSTIVTTNYDGELIVCPTCRAYGSFFKKQHKIDWISIKHNITRAYNDESELIQKGWEYHD